MKEKIALNILVWIIKFFIVSVIATLFSIPILSIFHYVNSKILGENFFTFHLYDIFIILIIKLVIWITISIKK